MQIHSLVISVAFHISNIVQVQVLLVVCEVEDGVADYLPRTVPRHLAAPIDAVHLTE